MDKISGFSLSRVISIFFNNVIVISFVYFLHSSAIKKKGKAMEKKEKGVHMRAGATKRGEGNRD